MFRRRKTWLFVALLLTALGCLVALASLRGMIARALGVSEAAQLALVFLSFAVLVIAPLHRLAGSRRVKMAVSGLLALVVAGALYVQGQHKIPDLLAGKYIQSWNVYHYYLGSKYFDELGYDDLYNYSVVADRERDKRLAHIKTVRDLASYERVPVAKAVATVDPEAFSPARWREFGDDQAYLLSRIGKTSLKTLMTDHGYNATPFGNFVFSSLSNSLSLHDDAQRTLLVTLDWIVLIPSFIFAAYAFGVGRALAVASCFVLFFGIGANMFGAMFRLHWFSATLVAVSAYKRGMYKVAGVAFAIAVAERILPVVFLAGPGLHAALAWLRTRTIAPHLRRFAISFAGGMALTTVLGASTGHGLSNFVEFRQAISTHAGSLATHHNKVGLETVFANDFDSDKLTTNTRLRRKTVAKNKSLYRTAALALSAAAFVMLLGAGERNSMFFGLLFAFTLTIMSRYYWVLWFLLLLVGPTMFRQRFRVAVFDALVIGVLPLYYVIDHYIDPIMVRYAVVNCYTAACMFAFAGLFLLEHLDAASSSTPTPPTNSSNHAFPDAGAKAHA